LSSLVSSSQPVKNNNDVPTSNTKNFDIALGEISIIVSYDMGWSKHGKLVEATIV